MRRANGRVGGKPRVLRDIVKAFRRPHRFAHCRFAGPPGPAVPPGFRAAPRMAPDVPHRYATRSGPKALGNRLYGSLSALLGISPLKSVALHKLRGDRAGQWAMTVNDRCRVRFRFEDGDAYDVEIVDYHRG